MRWQVLRVLGYVALVCLSSWAKDKSSQSSNSATKADVQTYSISFKQNDPVPGMGAALAIRLPFECTSDGTVFITMVQPLGTGSQPANLAQFSPSFLLTSIGTSGEAHSFPLNQVPELYDVSDVDHFVSDSKVIFLLRAAPGSGSGISSGSESPAKVEHHLYAVAFNREGTYQKTTQLDEAFDIYRIGLFPSGNYLAWGFDQNDHAPQLAILKEDGSVLEYLTVPKGDLPDKVIGKSADAKGPVLAPAQLIGHGHSIYVVQLKTDFPILEVSEAGTIRAIRARLQDGLHIKRLIPSDTNLYAWADGQPGRIYELDAQSRDILRQFSVGEGQAAANVACVHDDKFLSFESKSEKLIPLVGTAELGP